MLTMQAFHDRLFSDKVFHNLYMRNLIRLTQVSIEKAATLLKSNITWNIWDSKST